jgi:heme-degrading monooxygenase HmoA
MIARIWNGSSLPQNGDAYVAHLTANVIPQLAAIDGYLGVYVLRKRRGPLIGFTVMTFWDSIDAIRRFAGPDAEVAVIAPEAKELLIAHDPRAAHFEVVVGQGAVAPPED